MVIHIEINILFFIILLRIAYQSAHNVNQQMSRVLFRQTAYGIMVNLLLDIAWLLVDGRLFPGARALNLVINALFLASGIVIGCVWYLYVLETLGYKITRRMMVLVMLPGAVFTVLNILSIWTGWIFTVTAENVYVRGPLFWLQEVIAVAVLLVSLLHCIIRLLDRRTDVPRAVVVKLIRFYIIPVIGTLAAMPFSGMPGTWTCAAVSIVLMYLESQDQEVLRDSLTGLNNRKTVPAVFEDYRRQSGGGKQLYLLMMDLDSFKKINDSFGHPTGDQALRSAARLFTQSLDGRKAMVARTGGDEFLMLAFFPDDAGAEAFIAELKGRFADYNREKNLPVPLAVSVGYCACAPEQTLQACMEQADAMLYAEKQRIHADR